MTSTPESVSRKRRLNAVIRAAAAQDPVPFVCECVTGGCFGVVWLDATDYDDNRADAAWRALAPGHGAAVFERREKAA